MSEKALSQLIVTISLVGHVADQTPKPSMAPHYPRGKAPESLQGIHDLLPLALGTGQDTLLLGPSVCVSPTLPRIPMSTPPGRLCSVHSLSCDL